MLSIVYSSVAARPFDDAELTALLRQSRAANDTNDITGMLLHRNGYFLQLLEGPDTAVRDKMRTIKGDPRHHDVRMLIEEHITERAFPDWSMGFPSEADLDPADVPGYRTRFDDVLRDDDEVTEVLPALRALVGWFTARTAGGR